MCLQMMWNSVMLCVMQTQKQVCDGQERIYVLEQVD